VTCKLYRLTGLPPAEAGDYIQVGMNFYKIKAIEPLYFPFINVINGVDVGFSSEIYTVPDLIPPNGRLYYITGVGVFGNIKFQIRYPSGNPRNTVGAKSVSRLDRVQAPYDIPFTFKFAVVAGDTLEVDVETPLPNTSGAIWFYGWKIKAKKVESAPSQVIVLEDVREFN